MRKIWIVIPFSTCHLSRDVFHYVSMVNESCNDINLSILYKTLDRYSGIRIDLSKSESIDIYSKTKLLITIKKVDLDMQDFPDTPNAKIKETSY